MGHVAFRTSFEFSRDGILTASEITDTERPSSPAMRSFCHYPLSGFPCALKPNDSGGFGQFLMSMVIFLLVREYLLLLSLILEATVVSFKFY